MAYTKAQEEQIHKYRYYLGLTREEAIAEMLADEEVDKMKTMAEINADITDEQKKVSAEMRRTTSAETKAVNAYGKTVKREKKADNDKAEIINILTSSLADKIADLEIVNAEREFTFTYNGRKMKITLALPREKKGT